MLALLLAGCELKAPETDGTHLIDNFDAHRHQHKQTFLIDPQKSEIRVYVYRTGPLAAFGHNHIILINDIHGKAWLGASLGDSAFHFTLDVSRFIVDPPALRQTAGDSFSSRPSPQDIRDTQRNMLGKRLLNADKHPVIEIWSEAIDTITIPASASLVITVREKQYQLQAPLQLTRDSHTVTATGRLTVRQSDLGLQPFSILMGALAVQDELDIHYSLLATTIP